MMKYVGVRVIIGFNVIYKYEKKDDIIFDLILVKAC